MNNSSQLDLLVVWDYFTGNFAFSNHEVFGKFWFIKSKDYVVPYYTLSTVRIGISILIFFYFMNVHMFSVSFWHLTLQ